MDLDEGALPTTGRAHVIHLPSALRNGTDLECETPPKANPFDELVEVMDQAWEEGRMTPEAVEEAIRDFRKGHPYA